MKKFQVHLRYQPGVAILDLSGDLNVLGDKTLTEAYQEAERNNPRKVVLNFVGVDYINSTGIGLLVTLLARARKDQRQILAFGVKNYYEKIFEYTRLSEYMPIFPDELSALSGSEVH